MSLITIKRVNQMSTMVEGIYKDGKIELLETPNGVPEGRVRVIVMPEPDGPKPPPRMMTFGRYPGDRSTLEDFKDAEWHGEKEWDAAGGQ